MHTPVIRPAMEHDISGLIALYTEFHEFHVRGMPDRLRQPESYDEAMLCDALRTILQRNDAQIFVAVLEKQLGGLVEVYLRQDKPHPLTVAHSYGFVQSLIVSAPFRGQGIDKQLVIAAHQ